MLSFLQIISRFVASFVAELIRESGQLRDTGVKYFLSGKIRNLLSPCGTCQLHPPCTLVGLVRSLLFVLLARACDGI